MQKEESEHKTPLNQRSRRLRQVDTEKFQRKLLTVLDREVNELMDESYNGKLSSDSSRALVNYLKLLKDLREAEENDLEKYSDEELEKLANQGESDA